MINRSSSSRRGPASSQTPLITPPPAIRLPVDSVALPRPMAASPQAAEGPPDPAAGTSQQVEVMPAPAPVLSPEEVIALALSRPQLTAIEKMLSGHTVVASASAAGVTRMTIYNWLRNDPKFQAAYNAWQLDAITGSRTKLLAMSDDAVTTVARAVKTDAKIALAVVKSLGLLDRPAPGSTDPAEIAKLQKLDKQRAQEKLDEEMVFRSSSPFSDQTSAED